MPQHRKFNKSNNIIDILNQKNLEMIGKLLIGDYK